MAETLFVARLEPRDLRDVRVMAAAEESISGRRPYGSQDLADGVHALHRQDSGDIVAHARIDPDAGVSHISARPGHPTAAQMVANAVKDRGLADRVWACGEQSAANRVTGRTMIEVRVLSRKIEPVWGSEPSRVPGVRIRPFNPDTDTDNWLHLNAAAYVDVQQGRLTGTEFADLREQIWYDPSGFFVAESSENDPGRLVGFHWTRIDPQGRIGGRLSGEVFMLGVAPSHRGSDLAQSLLETGLHHMVGRGLRDVHLYVGSTNERAGSFYRKNGFAQIDVDRLIEIDPAQPNNTPDESAPMDSAIRN